MSFDFQNEKAWETSTDTLLPIGNHPVEIEEAESDHAQSSGNPQLKLRVSNSQGAMRDWISITPSTVGKVVQVFDAVGVERPKEGEFDPATGKLSDACVRRLLGQKVGVVVREEEDTREFPAKKRLRIKGYVPVDKVGPSTGSAPTATASAPAARKDDDIPF
jgi:hypothetical protein